METTLASGSAGNRTSWTVTSRSRRARALIAKSDVVQDARRKPKRSFDDRDDVLLNDRGNAGPPPAILDGGLSHKQSAALVQRDDPFYLSLAELDPVGLHRHVGA